MRVYITGATGFIGSAIVQELLQSGHQVFGLARSESGAQSLVAAGAGVHRGDLEDLDSLRSQAALSDVVIHTAFNHDFSQFAANCENDRQVIQALGSALIGTGKLLIVTSGTATSKSAPGTPSTEDDPPASSKLMPRAATEEAAAAVADLGVRVAVVRLPQVHDTEKQGLVSYAIHVAREKGVAAYVGDGLNRWPAVHRFDAVRLYRLALEKTNGSATYHAVAEEGVPSRDIAAAIGRGLNVPVVSIQPGEADGHFGWLGRFMALDIPASSKITRAKLGWSPTGPGLISDLDNMRFQ